MRRVKLVADLDPALGVLLIRALQQRYVSHPEVIVVKLFVDGLDEGHLRQLAQHATQPHFIVWGKVCNRVDWRNSVPALVFHAGAPAGSVSPWYAASRHVSLSHGDAGQDLWVNWSLEPQSTLRSAMVQLTSELLRSLGGDPSREMQEVGPGLTAVFKPEMLDGGGELHLVVRSEAAVTLAAFGAFAARVCAIVDEPKEVHVRSMAELEHVLSVLRALDVREDTAQCGPLLRYGSIGGEVTDVRIDRLEDLARWLAGAPARDRALLFEGFAWPWETCSTLANQLELQFHRKASTVQITALFFEKPSRQQEAEVKATAIRLLDDLS